MKPTPAGLARFRSRPVTLCLCALIHLLFAIWLPAADPAGNPKAVLTFECVGLYWKTPQGAADRPCEVSYRASGEKDWRQALPLWFDPRNQEYRGSIVQLRPDTTYEIALQLKATGTRASLQAQTWSETFPVGQSITLPVRSSEPLTITGSGSPAGYAVYAPATQAGEALIDVADKADHCVVIKASYIILRGLTLRNARIHGVLLGDGVHDVVIEGCDISGWGRVMADGWGRDYDAAIYSRSAALKRVIVQRNRIHHPRSNSNNWQQPRPAPGKREPSHPEGPQAVCFWDSDGNHVIRYNTVFSDDARQYNDIFGAGQNFSTRGFPNCDSDIYGNLLSHCWDDAIESEGANCNVRIWGNYMNEVFVGVACASSSLGPLYVWRNVTGVIRESPDKTSGAFLKTSDRMGGGKIFVFHNTVLQPASSTNSSKTLGAVVGLGWGGPMTNVTSRNNILHVTRQAITDRARGLWNDFDYDLFSAAFTAADGQEKHGLRGVPEYAAGSGFRNGKGVFTLSAGSRGFDAGVVLPNFNDGFTGAGPDLGADEAGTAPMEFGVDAYRPNERQGGNTLYDPDPQHLWNRLHQALFVRRGPNTRSYGLDRLEPLLWPGSKHLLAGPSHDSALKLLNEFIEQHGETLVHAPLKQALLQRDLWSVFTWLEAGHLCSGDSGVRAEQLRESLPRLRQALAAVLGRLALSPGELKDVPDNYAAAVASGSFARTYAAEQPGKPYLPPDLFAPAGPWICLGRPDGPVAPDHLREDNCFRNSAFLLFLRLPGGREAALDYLQQLPRQSSANHLPAGAEVALVRRALLLASSAKLIPTALTESIQVRVYHRTGQSFYEYRLSRSLLLAGQAGGLQAVGSDERDFKTGFAGPAWDPFEDIPSGESFEANRRPIRSECIACHPFPGGLKADRPPPSLLAISPEKALETAIKWKQDNPDWTALQHLLAR
jgi:hypothetical protein